MMRTPRKSDRPRKSWRARRGNPRHRSPLAFECLEDRLAPAVAGVFSWAADLGSTGTDEGQSIARDSAGNIYVTGVFGGRVNFNPTPRGPAVNLTSHGNSDVFFAKYSSMGSLLWAKR